MLRQHIEAHKVCVFVADEGTFHEEVVLFKHQLAEALQVMRPTHIKKQLGVLKVRRELVESLWLAAVRLI